jgi:hypothetical protein
LMATNLDNRTVMLPRRKRPYDYKKELQHDIALLQKRYSCDW